MKATKLVIGAGQLSREDARLLPSVVAEAEGIARTVDPLRQTDSRSAMASATAATAPLPHSTRLSANRERRSSAVLAPSAERIASSGSRRTVRASTRLATFELAITKSRPEAANRIHKIVLARELIC